jgi:hypothetical protein
MPAKKPDGPPPIIPTDRLGKGGLASRVVVVVVVVVVGVVEVRRRDDCVERRVKGRLNASVSCNINTVIIESNLM